MGSRRIVLKVNLKLTNNIIVVFVSGTFAVLHQAIISRSLFNIRSVVTSKRKQILEDF